MWSPDPLRRGLAVLALIALAGGLAGCQVRPLYGTAPDGSNVRADLAHVDVAPIQGRAGQQVRNDLLFLMHGGQPAGGAYVVDLAVQKSVSSLIVRRISGRPQGRTVTLDVDFELRQPGAEEPLFWGRVVRRASYEWTNQRFANERAERDAVDRAAREVAEEIRLRLATYFASDGEVRPEVSPRIDPQLEDLTDFSEFSDSPGQ